MQAFKHGLAQRPGVLVVNLGTPQAATTGAVRRYLAEFLSDPRVVEIPRVAWLPILHGIILRVRPKKSAAKYASIWTPEGSPLMVWSRLQALLLKGALGEKLVARGFAGDHAPVVLAMRYGEPSIPQGLGKLRAAGCDRILVVPLYPQYAASTTASAMDAVYAELKTWRYQPALRSVHSFHDDTAYIRAMASRVSDTWMKHGKPDVFVMSFHGIPRRSLDLGDPYFCFCHKTGRLLAEALGLAPEQFRITFQSRFGKAKWLEPYTEPTLVALAQQSPGKRVDVFCPGFVADCLETLEEIAQEAKHAYQSAGGGEFNYIPALNDSGAWINALAELTLRNLEGWLSPPSNAAELTASVQRAQAQGAST